MVKYVTIVCERLIFMFFLEIFFQEQTQKSNHSQTIVTDLTIQTIVTYSTILTIVSDSLRVA